MADLKLYNLVSTSLQAAKQAVADFQSDFSKTDQLDSAFRQLLSDLHLYFQDSLQSITAKQDALLRQAAPFADRQPPNPTLDQLYMELGKIITTAWITVGFDNSRQGQVFKSLNESKTQELLRNILIKSRQ